MKTTIKILVISLFFTFSFSSCVEEELFIEPVVEEEVGDDTNDDGNNVNADATAPCEFDLVNLQPNATLTFNCILDLNGETIAIPSGVTLVFEGGDIINGTLHLAENTVISGRLLNSSLNLTGRAPRLRETTFNFDPNRWGIVEGVVPIEIAYNNTLIIKNVLSMTKELGAEVFFINKLNAYFEYSLSPTFINAVFEIPSDFHLKMTDNTFLHIMSGNSLMKIYKGNNIRVSGGHLIGDRIERNGLDGYSLFEIKGGQNIVIENMDIQKSSSAGLTINSELFLGDPNYISSRDILVTNCYFDSNRGNNLSITDGTDIIVENCESYRAGIDIGNSIGFAPRIGIVVEPVQGQRTERIIIRNNVVKESGGNEILIAWGDDMTISGNESDGEIGWTGASNVKVIDNILDGGGIIGGLDPWFLEINNGHVISGNIIKNAPTGIAVTNDKIKIFNNTIENCVVGMMFRNLKDSEIYNNLITGNTANSFGLNAQVGLKNVLIRNNNVALENGRSFFMGGINSQDHQIDNEVIIEDNNFNCGKAGSINYSSGFNILNNKFTNYSFGITSSKNVLIDGNEISVLGGYALHLNNYTSLKNIVISNNFIENKGQNSGSHGIRINTVNSNFIVEDNNITINNNIIKVRGFNHGIYAVNFNGFNIFDNEFLGTTVLDPDIYIRGNNSTIINNNTIRGVDVEGSNNVVNNNN